jgi:ATP-dependent DNA ligase
MIRAEAQRKNTEALSLLRCRSCLIDGEVVICGADGVPIFDRLREGSRIKPEALLYRTATPS